MKGTQLCQLLKINESLKKKKKESTGVAASAQRSTAYLQKGLRKLLSVMELLYLDCGSGSTTV